MESTTIGVSSLSSSRIGYGCWRVAGTWDHTKVTADGIKTGKAAIAAAYESGFTLFDNAEIYCRGEAERLLGSSLKEISGMRGRVLVATKCGIRPAGEPTPDAPGRYDFSAEYILRACEGSLKRLGVETIDLYMLHRPDYLADPQEIAKAFAELRNTGKVRYFGVSNFRPTLVTVLQAVCPMPLIVHQVEISLAKLDSFTDGTLDQCLIEGITPMAWSPLAGGLLGDGAKNLLPSQKLYQPMKFLGEVETVARAHGATRTQIALAWLLLHPSKILPVIGSTDPARIREASKAAEVKLTREEWYRLLIAARGEALP
jgi:predicted oxidoreductase